EYVQNQVPRFTQREFSVEQMPELQGTLRGALTLAHVPRPVDPGPPRVVPPAPNQLPEPRILAGHGKRVWSVALAGGGPVAGPAGGDGAVRLWDTAEGRSLRTLYGHTGEVYAVAFSASGRLLLSGGQDKTARVWDAADGKELARFNGHTGGVFSAAFCEDGR